MTLTPLRVLVATAPSGGQIRFVKYDDQADRELSFYHGLLSPAEDQVFWRAKLAAERPGVEMWEKARSLLELNGWTIGAIE